MIATEAKKISEALPMSKEWIASSIRSLIFQEAVNGKLHCDWYSDRLHIPTEEDLETISKFTKLLEEEGYNCRAEVLEPTCNFTSRVIRVHISWEDNPKETMLKVGEKVYSIYYGFNSTPSIKEDEILSIFIQSEEDITYNTYYVEYGTVGEHIFKTYEEAEKYLETHSYEYYE